MTRQRLQEILKGFEDLSILVVGDFFLDEYLITDPALAEFSLETGLEAIGLIDHEFFGEKSQSHVSNNLSSLPEQLTTLIFIPLIEQIFFTGIILQSLLKKINAITAVYTSSLIYTLAGFKLTLGTFGLGICASSLYKLTGTLYASILFHISCALGGILLENIYPKIRIILGFLY